MIYKKTDTIIGHISQRQEVGGEGLRTGGRFNRYNKEAGASYSCKGLKSYLINRKVKSII